MITITKYTEQVNKNDKAIGHIFEFNYMNKSGTILPARIEFSNREFEENRDAADTPLLTYFEKTVRKNFDVIKGTKKADRIEKTNNFDTPESITAKFGTNIIE